MPNRYHRNNSRNRLSKLNRDFHFENCLPAVSISKLLLFSFVNVVNKKKYKKYFKLCEKKRKWQI